MNKRDDETFPQNPEEARLDIELTRKELGETAQALAHKLNIPARARESAQHRAELARTQLRQRTTEARSRLRQRTTQARSQLHDGTVRARESVEKNPMPAVVAGALAALAVGGLILWRVKR